ncbi:MAG: hypothetical protein BroJett026_36830 [Betaproteobacteria bacterium]|nr:MAG: hypothetical protein BroJett026_36830 [Betaproteobacteria bacterium]
MADPDVLTHAYLDSHPADAARVLEGMPREDAAALFARLPARLGAPVLAAMRPHVAARVLPPDVPHAALLLGPMSVPAAAAVLRALPEPRRRALIDALPTAMALACQAVLGYPEDAVGACVETEVVALAPGTSVRDALAALHAARARTSAPVYVVDGQRAPRGQVELWALLQADPARSLDSLAGDLPGTLPAVMPIRGALDHALWRRADVAPVVERSGVLVGSVERRALAQAMRERAAERGPEGASVAGIVAGAYWQAVVALIEAAVTLLFPPERDRA